MDVRELPEVARVGTLLRLGHSEGDLRFLRSAGHLVRIRHGLYARPDARSDVVRAVRLGGRLTSFSALATRGIWCPPGDDRLHVAVNAHAHSLRDPDSGGVLRARHDVALHWNVRPAPRSGRVTGIVPTALAVRHLPASLDEAYTVAVLDSAVSQGLVTSDTLALEFSGSRRLERALALFDPSAESGVESVARVRMLAAGLQARSQVWFGSCRVDFVLEGSVVVEIDGRAVHDGDGHFERDRRRAADLTRRGLHVLHFSYAQVMYDWAVCLATIRAALGRAG